MSAQEPWFITNEQAELAAIEAWREATVVSAFQAHQALDDTGYIEAVETVIADPATTEKTRRAWNMAQEFRRMSPTVLELAAALELTAAQVDELFEYALTIEA